MSLWYGVFSAGGTPSPIANRVEKVVREALANPQIREQMAQQGVESAPAVTSTAFRRLVADDLAKWGKVIKDANIQLE
jgi:tripartite-type tricarboxylate transporter receptor subunit TctC